MVMMNQIPDLADDELLGQYYLARMNIHTVYHINGEDIIDPGGYHMDFLRAVCKEINKRYPDDINEFN